MTENTQKAPSPFLHLTIGDKEERLFMSFGLLNRVMTMMGGVGGLEALLQSPELSAAVVREMVAERTPSGKLVAYRELDDLALDADGAAAVIDWVVEHVLGFFVKRGEKMGDLVKDQKAVVDRLQAMFGGGEISRGEIPSA